MNIEEQLSDLFLQHNLRLDNFLLHSEGREYDACQFEIYNKKIIYRAAKKTPKKVGYFVTLWQRGADSKTKPFDLNDSFDFVVIGVKKEGLISGMFIFPKVVLHKQKILSDKGQKGKLGFRIYEPSSPTVNATAIRSRAWQTEHFHEFDERLDSFLKTIF